MTSKPDNTTKTCPYCAEEILAAAVKCRHCLSMLPSSDGRQLCTSCRDNSRSITASERDDIDLASLRPHEIALALASDFSAEAGPSFATELDDALNAVRRAIAEQYGVVAPHVRVSTDPELRSHEYQLTLRGVPVSGGELPSPSATTASINELSRHVRSSLEQHLDQFLTREKVARMLNSVRQTDPTVVAELIPNLLALGQIRQVLQNLVREQVSIIDLSLILNELADQSMFTKDAFQLTEHVRTALGRRIFQHCQATDGLIRAFILSPDAERIIQNSIQFVENSQQLMLNPNQSKALQNNLSVALERHRDQYVVPVIVVNGRVRRHVKALLERNFANMVVLSYSEIVGGVQLENLETIELYGPGHVPTPPPPPTPTSDHDRTDDGGMSDYLSVHW